MVPGEDEAMPETSYPIGPAPSKNLPSLAPVDWDVEPATEAERKALVSRWLDEVHALDYGDTVSTSYLILTHISYPHQIEDMPTRFKYTNVAAEDFGLDDHEILLANDEELQDLVPLRKLNAYRKDIKRTRYQPAVANKIRSFKYAVKNRKWQENSQVHHPARKTAAKRSRTEDSEKSLGDHDSNGPAASGESAVKKKRKGKKERDKLAKKNAELAVK